MSVSNPQLDISSDRPSCWVCFGNEQDSEDKDGVWVQPCKCKGTMTWVHESCLQRWIDEKQKRAHGCPVACSHCKTHYIICYPPNNCLVDFLERFNKFLSRSAPFAAMSIGIGSIYLSLKCYGSFCVKQVMGQEDGSRILDGADFLLVCSGLPAIPVLLVLSKIMIKWEDLLLKLWLHAKIPKPLRYIIDQPPQHPRTNCEHILFEPGLSDPLYLLRMSIGALLLPTMSALVGKVFFGFLSGPQWRKSLVGGLSFLLLKGALKIYLRKSLYIRYSQRTIKNYKEHTDSLTSTSRRNENSVDDVDPYETMTTENSNYNLSIGYNSSVDENDEIPILRMRIDIVHE